MSKNNGKIPNFWQKETNQPTAGKILKITVHHVKQNNTATFLQEKLGRLIKDFGGIKTFKS